MNIFGIGGPELIAILIIMLVFAGPKRMIHWAYIMGEYIGKFRVIWSQTVDIVQKEFDDAGVDIKLPKEPPTRQNLNKSMSDAFKPLTQPMQESLDEIQKDMDSIKAINNEVKTTPSTTKSSTASKEDAKKPMGTWGGQNDNDTKSDNTGPNDQSVNMGTWSSPSTNE